MEKWGYENEGISVDEYTGDDLEFDFTDSDATPFDDPTDVMPQPEEEIGDLLEDHNCRTAHPGTNHDLWLAKHG